MPNHTADTLKFYLGMEVALKINIINNGTKFKKGVLHNLDVSETAYIVPNEGHNMRVHTSDIFPILKTAEELNDEILEQIYGNKDHRLNTAFQSMPECVLESHHLFQLLKEGYGAIPDNSSPTGYVDFIHKLPCVTPKMIEEGVEV